MSSTDEAGPKRRTGTSARRVAPASTKPLDPTGRGSRGRRRVALPASRPWWRGPWLIVVVVGALAMVLLGLILAGRRQSTALVASPAETAQVIDAVTQIPAVTFETVGTGGVSNPLKSEQASPLLGPNGHPEVMYVGAEYCPYCASERWSLIAALSRLGSFSGLELTTSTDADIFPNTPTFSFVHSQYTSQYVDFVAIETETRSRAPLQTPTAAQRQLLTQLDPPGSIPFLDVGNRYLGVGGGYSNDVLTGKTWTEIAASLSNPSSPVTQAILGNANYITAALCRVTGDQPGDVCSTPTLTQIKGRLGA